MITLFDKLLSLPDSLTTPEQRAQWQAFQALIPPLPVNAAGTTILPARVLSIGKHNNEGPELYAVHPHRLFTKGKQVATGFNISLGLSTFASSGFSRENEGWNYGLNAAALLGLSQEASAMMLARSSSGPASGYRFPGFAPHMQDFGEWWGGGSVCQLMQCPHTHTLSHTRTHHLATCLLPFQTLLLTTLPT